MRDLYKIFDKLVGTKSIVSFHFKSFPVKPFYLTIYDKDSNCHLYEGQTMEDLERQVIKEWGHLIHNTGPTLPLISMPTPQGFPKP